VGEILSTEKAILLFVLGIVFALLAFPVAFYVSVGLGYAFAIIAVILGAYLISKHGGRALPLALGTALIVFSLAILTGTAMVHMGVWTLKEATEILKEEVEKVTEIKTIHGELAKPIRAGDWEITVLGVKEAIYIREDESYYRAKEGYKVVIVTLRIKNVGKETASPSNIWKFVIVTNINKSYERAYTYELTPVLYVTQDIKSKAIMIRELDTLASLVPGTYVEGDILFQIPKNEMPERLHFKVGVVGGYEVIVELRTS